MSTARASAGSVEATRSRGVWLVLGASFVVFILLCGTALNTFTSYLQNVTVAETGILERHQGTQLSVVRNRSVAAEAVNDASVLHEGDTLRTGEDTEAHIDVFGGTVTVETYFSTTLKVTALRSGRFVQNSRDLVVNLQGGTAVLVTGVGDASNESDYRLTTPELEVTLLPQSKIRARVNGQEGATTTNIVVVDGSAVVTARGKKLQVTRGFMVNAVAGQPPDDPIAAEEELVSNGNFTDPPTRGADEKENGGLGTAAWQALRDTDALGEVSATDPGSAQIISETVGGSIVNSPLFKKTGSDGRYAKVGIKQEISRPADFYSTIELQMTVKIVNQSFPVGGPQGNVYPLSAKLLYTDANGKSHEWTQSFYYTNKEPDKRNPSEVFQGSWSTKRFLIKSASRGQDIHTIDALEIYGYGVQFQSWATAISLRGR